LFKEEGSTNVSSPTVGGGKGNRGPIFVTSNGEGEFPETPLVMLTFSERDWRQNTFSGSLQGASGRSTNPKGIGLGGRVGGLKPEIRSPSAQIVSGNVSIG
jgi:hypothetical protein